MVPTKGSLRRLLNLLIFSVNFIYENIFMRFGVMSPRTIKLIK